MLSGREIGCHRFSSFVGLLSPLLCHHGNQQRANERTNTNTRQTSLQRGENARVLSEPAGWPRHEDERKVAGVVSLLQGIPEIGDALANDPLVVEALREVLSEVVAAPSHHRSNQLLHMFIAERNGTGRDGTKQKLWLFVAAVPYTT